MLDEIANQYNQDPVTRKIELVAAYVRVSTTEQKLHGLSLDAQKAKLADYAKKNNMKIVGWYVDEGVSGRKLIKNRPELQRMIQDAEKGKFTRCIFIKLDRFFRSVAEYHEAMKRMAPVIWTATEEKYDLSTANGRFFVNAKLAIAEMEADQTGERIRLVNEYKVQTGQPLVGDTSQPFGFKNGIDKTTGRKNVIHDPDVEDIVHELIDHYLTHQSKRKTMLYLHAKHHIGLSYSAIGNLLTNTMLYGAYRDNPSYCEPYIDKITFDKIQEILKRNVKQNTADNRAYLFGGLIKCPHCGSRLKGSTVVSKPRQKTYVYKIYRCGKAYKEHSCDYRKVIGENRLEKMMLANIEQYLADAKIRSTTITDSNEPSIPKHDIDDIHTQIDRLNYSWQTGKIRTVEQYEKQYAELMDKLAEAEAERGEIIVKDFSKIDAILHGDWKDIYQALDDTHKRAFWRSFIQSIDVNWTTDTKEIVRVNFF